MRALFPAVYLSPRVTITIGYGGTDGYGTTNINLDLSGDAAFVAGGGIRLAYSSDNTNNRTGTIANVDMTGYSSMSAGSYIRIATGVAPTDTATHFDIGTLTMSGNSKITAGTNSPSAMLSQRHGYA